ncbi:hypothetical protein MW887_008140 [Aspergillus wentii]|nr:hypothetical protein MW887_008140 [Aspergillus wentii]
MRLQYLSLIPVLSSVVAASDCKCTPSNPCWPSPTDWNSLNETISGRLIHTTPLGSVCYPTEPNYNKDACSSVLSNWTNSAFHSADPASIDGPEWAGSSCNPIYPNGTSITGDPHAGRKGCSVGKYPPYVVNVTEASDVQVALQFAKKWKLRFNVKNTGHNAEKTAAYGSLSVWMHNLKDIQFHESFQPQSCKTNKTQMAATIGAGVQDGELFAAMAKYDAMAVGGTNADVGFVGWATGGGHGMATGTYGMGADNIVQAVIVTPTGDILTANECQNEDIFWAIRGGGGGTFGVIISVTVKAYKMPSTTLVGVDLSRKNGTSSKDWWRHIAEVHGAFPQLQDAGAHGYYSSSAPSESFTISLLLYNTTNSTTQRIISPLRKMLSAANATATFAITSQSVPKWYDLVKNLPNIESVGTTQGIRTSRFIPRRAVEDVDLLAEMLERSTEKGLSGNGVSNPSISGTMTGSKIAVNNALNPAWRDSIAHLIVSQSWDDTLPESVANKTIYDMTYKRGYALRQLAPDSGAYFNEANPYEIDWQWSFFGPNYARLHEIKQKYDPEGILWCHHCVGSERWAERRDGSLCRAY